MSWKLQSVYEDGRELQALSAKTKEDLLHWFEMWKENRHYERVYVELLYEGVLVEMHECRLWSETEEMN